MEQLQSNMSSNTFSFHDMNLSNLKDRCGLTVKISAGAHSGAQLCFPITHKETITVGSSPHDDVVLLASKVAETHFAISPGSFADNQVTIIAKNSSVTLSDGQLLGAAQWAKMSLPCTITFGDTAIQLSRNISTKTVKKIAEPVLLLGGSIVLGALVTAVVASGFSHIKQAVANTDNAPKAVVAQTSPSAYIPNIQRQAQTTVMLRKQLIQAGLNTYLTIQKGPVGTVEVSGVISEQQRNNWRAVLQWYDSQTDIAEMVNKVTTGNVQNLKLVIKSIWLDGDDRVVVFADGQMAKIGETIKNGWKVSAISRNYVAVNRGQRTIKITY